MKIVLWFFYIYKKLIRLIFGDIWDNDHTNSDIKNSIFLHQKFDFFYIKNKIFSISFFIKSRPYHLGSRWYHFEKSMHLSFKMISCRSQVISPIFQYDISLILFIFQSDIALKACWYHFECKPKWCHFQSNDILLNPNWHIHIESKPYLNLYILSCFQSGITSKTNITYKHSKWYCFVQDGTLL